LKIEWGPKAAADLMELFEYIAADNIEAANRVREQIFNQTDMLADFSQMGRLGRVRGTRELVIKGTPYIVGYRAAGNVVIILRVLHGARRWPRKM